MGRPNYQYEKRARELAKKKKKEDKLKRRQEKNAQGQGDGVVEENEADETLESAGEVDDQEDLVPNNDEESADQE